MLHVGLIGTGYAAQKRWRSLQATPEAQPVALMSPSRDRCLSLDPQQQARHYNTWQALLEHRPLDLVMVANANHLHGTIVAAALTAGLHVVCEYPLALDFSQAQALVELAQQQHCLLHVEHIELLGSLHQTVRHILPKIGRPCYAHYTTLSPKQPVSHRWNYHHQEWGFPFMAALSRFNRLIDYFGPVAAVSCHSQFADIANTNYYRACLCSAQLQFQQGVLATITYGKGEWFAETERTLMIQGDRGTVNFAGSQGQLTQANQQTPLSLGSRRGVFDQDTRAVIAHLLQDQALYTTPQASCYALQVAQAARQAAQTGQTIALLS
ncbi:MAG: Gfo/Idh/MocA family oxidoreductase [Cyanobacteria bacterium P01_G01_bin.54]